MKETTYHLNAEQSVGVGNATHTQTVLLYRDTVGVFTELCLSRKLTSVISCNVRCTTVWSDPKIWPIRMHYLNTLFHVLRVSVVELNWRLGEINQKSVDKF